MKTALERLSINGIAVSMAESRAAMGRQAAAEIAEEIRVRLQVQPEVRIVFAAAPSQAEMLESLRRVSGIDWTRVAVFHMDEYLGLAPDAPQRFGKWLRGAIFDHLPFAAVHVIEPGDDAARCAAEYAAKLQETPIDIVCCGIGVNGHLAFNDPPADFDDLATVKIVDLDTRCRQQQVDDGCFAAIGDVPRQALTLTVPALLGARAIFCTVPGAQKAEVVQRAVLGPVDPMCPASALRRHARCTMYLDGDSAAGLRKRD